MYQHRSADISVDPGEDGLRGGRSSRRVRRYAEPQITHFIPTMDWRIVVYSGNI